MAALSGHSAASVSVVGERHVSACFGFVIDFHDAIEHPVGWRFGHVVLFAAEPGSASEPGQAS
jgi:hypothetical protein